MVSSLVNVVLGFILVYYFGMRGAATASVVSFFIWNYAFWIIAKQKSGIDSSVLSLFKGL